jgi:LacI family transcriptional regulator
MKNQEAPVVAAPKRPSITDVANHAGVSKAAVSKVLRNAYGVSPAMRQRVEAAMDQLTYRPSISARAMRGASFTIGFEIPQIGNDFFSQIMDGASTGISDSRYQMIIAPGLGNLRSTSILDALVDRQVDGIIAVASEVPPEWLEQLASTVPLVIIGRHDRSHAYDTVTNNDRAGITLAMRHLRGQGHSRIAHLTLRPPQDPRHVKSPHAIRLATYRAAMKADGLEPRVVFTHTNEIDAYDATKALLGDKDRPTAILAGHDTLALGVLHAIADLGLTTRDVSVVGYDNIQLAEHPLIALTTIDQFGPAIGATAIDLLMDRIRSGRTSAKHEQIEPQLRVRHTTHQLPANRSGVRTRETPRG